MRKPHRHHFIKTTVVKDGVKYIHGSCYCGKTVEIRK